MGRMGQVGRNHSGSSGTTSLHPDGFGIFPVTETPDSLRVIQVVILMEISDRKFQQFFP